MSSTQPCHKCKQQVGPAYYLQDKNAYCSPCHERATAPPRLHGLVAFLRTVMAGSVVAALCAVVNFLIFYFFNIEMALVWIFLSALIGGVVLSASERRRSVFYRLLALGFTYLAIGLSLVLCLVSYMLNPPKAEAGADEAGKPAIGSHMPALVGLGKKPTPSVSATPGAPATAEQPQLTREELLSPVGLAILFVGGAFLMVAMPVLVGVQNLVAALIYGLALYQAWKSATPPSFTGPHSPEEEAPEQPAEEPS